MLTYLDIPAGDISAGVPESLLPPGVALDKKLKISFFRNIFS